MERRKGIGVGDLPQVKLIKLVLVLIVMLILLAWLVFYVLDPFELLSGILGGAGSLMAAAVPDLGSLLDFGMGDDGESCEGEFAWETLEVREITQNPQEDRTKEAILTFNKEVTTASTKRFIPKVSPGLFIENAWEDGNQIILNLNPDSQSDIPSSGEMLEIEIGRDENTGIQSTDGCMIATGSCEAPYMGGEAQCDVSVGGDGGGNTDDGQNSPASDSGEGSSLNQGDGSADQEEEDNTFTVRFVPRDDRYTDSNYGSTSEFQRRVDVYTDGLMQYTPFQHCGGALETTVDADAQESLGATSGDADVTVLVSAAEPGQLVSIAGTTRNAEGWGGFSYGPPRDEIIMFDVFVPYDGAEYMAVAHEMGHEFGFCDEYSREEWNRQNSGYSGGCVNDRFPADSGLVPSPMETVGWARSGDNQYCTDIGSGADYTCGLDVDGDPNTFDPSIMGGGAMYQITSDNRFTFVGRNVEYRPTPGVQSPDPGLPNSQMQAWADILQNDHGVTCEGVLG